MKGVRKVEGVLYRISDQTTGFYQVVECVSEEALIRYVAELTKQTIVSNVVRIEVGFNKVSTPRFAVHSNPLFKSLIKDRFKK